MVFWKLSFTFDLLLDLLEECLDLVVFRSLLTRLFRFRKTLEVDQSINFPHMCFDKVWFDSQGKLAVFNALFIFLELEISIGPVAQIKMVWIFQPLDSLGVKFERFLVAAIDKSPVARLIECLWILLNFFAHLFMFLNLVLNLVLILID
jgi:hypothetical protein